MEDENLCQLLEKLHAELEQAQVVDEESRALLQHLKEDINSLLERCEEPQELPDQVVNLRLEEAVEQFEVTHPDLTITIGHLLDILSQGGI